jgi:two-component system KDP operon response regulator KdpE
MPDNAVSVLVVDDEPPIRRLLRTSLFAQGYRVIEAERGTEAIESIRQQKPDIVVLDLGLPDIDGLAVIQRVRQDSLVPIIVLSSRSDERGKVEALDLGADDYVTKPFGMEELVARIRTALRHRLQQQGEPAVFVSGDLAVDLVHREVGWKKWSPTFHGIG